MLRNHYIVGGVALVALALVGGLIHMSNHNKEAAAGMQGMVATLEIERKAQELEQQMATKEGELQDMRKRLETFEKTQAQKTTVKTETQPSSAMQSYSGVNTPCVKPPYPDFMSYAREFLPPAGFPPQYGDDENITKFQNDMHARQYPSQCPASDAAFFSQWCPYGTSACFHLLSRPMTAAWEAGKPIIMNGGHFSLMGKTKDPYCQNKSVSCFIEPVSNCTELSGYTPFNAQGWAKRFIPKDWAHMGYFWWVSQQMRFLFRLNEHVKKEVAATKKRIGWKDGVAVLGIHVRHGDSCKVRLHCWPFEMYMEEARRLRSLYGVSTIYLATDSKAIIEKAKKHGDGWNFLFLDFDRSHFDLIAQGKVVSPFGFDNPSLDDCHGTGQCDPVSDMFRMMVDLELLRQSNFFIGAFSANGGRLVYELMAATKGCMPPFISLDVHWCHMGGYAMEGYTEWMHTSC